MPIQLLKIICGLRGNTMIAKLSFATIGIDIIFLKLEDI